MIPYFTLPTLRLFGQPLYPYTYLVMAGMALTYVLGVRRARQVGLHTPLAAVGLFWVAVGGFIGAHVVEVIAYHPERLLENPLVLLEIWEGLSSFGGFLGGTVALWLYCQRQGIWMLAYVDAMMFGFAPGFILARGGCFVSHDHPGLHSDFWLAVAYPGGARHDLGFYEVLLAASITVVLYALPRRKTPRFVGFYSALVMAIYAPARFLLDFLRTDDRRYLGLTPAQYLSVLMLGLALYLYGQRHRHRPLEARSSEAMIDEATETGEADDEEDD